MIFLFGFIKKTWEYRTSLPPYEDDLNKFSYLLNNELRGKELTIDNTNEALRKILPLYIKREWQ